ncbi:CwfJ C-terminus 1-domain-containing protein-like protein [Lasiosphaeria ovina]|uniref:CwfJ C-terminus 1-domain-containing protein-like protein n=1 Tax=Lasiosphaeria ovina TaxID=92902 RepID=A0AAE0NJS2_9PEZI|nr:CwfJ C-terminus 1-domain-containing protein-like protein [Lasiosphaeria ovina]
MATEKKAPKIFVFGSVNGQLRSAFTKIGVLHAKNDFSFGIITGNLFATEQDDEQLSSLLNGNIEIPCPVYFTSGTVLLPHRVVEKIQEGDEIAPNLYFLDKRSITNTLEGVRIVTLGGVPLPEDAAPGTSQELSLAYYGDGDAKSLQSAKNVDILLTSVWPTGIWNKSAKAIEMSIDSATAPNDKAVAELCKALKPAYHFATSRGNVCFEREPFASVGNDTDGDSIAVTRFISLAPWGNAEKAKSMYAFTINREAFTAPPPGSTATPFPGLAPKKRSAEDAGFSRFSHGHDNRHGNRKHRRDRSPPPGPDRCFFCLSNTNLPQHMITSIGDEAYLVTAKGPLPAADTFGDYGLAFPCHFIIAPLDHAPSVSTEVMGVDKAKKTYEDMEMYLKSLQKMVSALSGRRLGTVAWEFNRARNIHVHWQTMPVPAAQVLDGSVEAAFRELAVKSELGEFDEEDFGTADEAGGDQDYLRVWIWAEAVDGNNPNPGTVAKSLVIKFDKHVPFDLQFPRKVMAKLLGLEHRVVWQTVGQTEQEETADVAAFREAFKPYDFTLLAQ